MKEEYLHYIWKFGLFDLSDLRTTKGKLIQIISKGFHNKNAGPDFLNARLKIGEITWIGNVEIHIRSSDWNKHSHQKDPAYNNVILHVVLLDDKEILNANGSKFPTLSLSSRIEKTHFDRYRNLIDSKDKIPCDQQISEVDDFIKRATLNRMMINRLERKTQLILSSYKNSGNDWKHVYYISLAKNFGMKVNSVPFEMLARSLPLSIISKHIDFPLQIESLLFGQAGFLENSFSEAYPNELKKEFEFLKSKFNLKPLNKANWKFMRMRPSNFPTIRLAQLASFLFKNKGLSNLVFSDFNLSNIKNAFDFEINAYWDDHYQLDTVSIYKKKKFGIDSLNNVIINTIVPMLFAYGVQNNMQELKDRALEIISKIPSEKNTIIKRWEKTGIQSDNAFHSQALIELRNEFCIQKKCLNCNIGTSLIKYAVFND